MQVKEFLTMVLVIISVFLLLGVANIAYGAELNVTRDFDNVTIYHTVKSDSGSQTVQGIENNAKLMSKDGKLMANGIYEDDNGRYEYNGMYLNDTLLNRSDRVYFKEPVLLTAHYNFIPFCNAEIIVNDPQGNADRHATFPHMNKEGDSLTQIFAEPCDYDTSSYEFINIIDTETNATYMPGDKYTITYNDCVSVGGNLTKTFEYVYKEIPKFNASITIIDPVGNTDGYVDFPNMGPNDSLTHTFKEPVDVDTVHYDFWYIVDETGTIYLQPSDIYTITYDDCLAVNDSISKVFEYRYGYFPDYTVTYISVNPNGVFDNITITVNRENWSAFYTLPEAPEIEGKVLDYIHIVEDDVDNYGVGDTYESMYDMCLSEGNNLTRTFEYIYKQGSYANVTVNYIVNATGSEYDGFVFNSINYTYLTVGEELIGGYVLNYPTINDFEFVSVTYSEEIVNGVKAMVDGSDVTNIGGFWVYEITETGDIALNFLYNYVSTKVDPAPEPTPTPTPVPGNGTDDNGTTPVDPTPEPTPVPGNDTDDNSTEPVDPQPTPAPVPEDDVVNNDTGVDSNETIPVNPINNNTTNTNTTTTNITVENGANTSTSSNIETVRMKETGNHILGWIVLFCFIMLFALFAVIDKE